MVLRKFIRFFKRNYLKEKMDPNQTFGLIKTQSASTNIVTEVETAQLAQINPMKLILKNCLRRIVKINRQKKLLLEEYMKQMTATDAHITRLLQEDDASINQLRQVGQQIIKDDEKNCSLLS